MTKERLVQLEDLLIWMSGGVAFTNDQANLFSEGLAFISAETVGESDTLPCEWCENPRMIDGWISIEGRGASMYIDEFRYCPACGREL